MIKIKVDIEERVERARAAFLKGYNCTQAVVVAYADLTGIDTDTVASLVEPLGGGMGRLREVCGAVSGMFMISSVVRRDEPSDDRTGRARKYEGVQLLAERFRTECGSIVCRELLGLAQQSDPPTPSERTAEYYLRRPCLEYVATAARMVGEYINEQVEE